MNRRTLAVLLAALGVAALVLGVLSATAWRASNVVAMSTPQRPAAPVLVTDPGVLELMPGDVEITATADDEQPITLVIARTEEVTGWVGASPHAKVTGATDWETLAVEDVPLGEGGTETVPSPSDVDGWPVELTESGSVTTTWVDEPGRWSLLAVTDGTAPAPELTLSWQREVGTPWLWPGVILGLLLLAAGAALFVRDEQKRRRRTARQRELGERASRRARADDDATSVMPAVRAGGSTAVAAGAGAAVAGSAGAATAATAASTGPGGTLPAPPVWTRDAADGTAPTDDAPRADDERTLPAPPVWTRDAAEPADTSDAVASVETVAEAHDAESAAAVEAAGTSGDAGRTLPAPPVWTRDAGADDEHDDDADQRLGRHAAPAPDSTLPAPPVWPREQRADAPVWTTDEPGGPPPPLSRMARRAREEGQQR